jgi:23S rRNA (adenine2503-C2)-methyltransferase
MQNLRHLSEQELTHAIGQLGLKPYAARQILDWIWVKHVDSIEQMSNLSKAHRALLTEHFSLNKIRIDHQQISEDGTIKNRFKLHDGYVVEGVLIPTDNRITACVSSQVGCSLTCKFCATGKMERKRNIDFDEIVDQAVIIHQQAMQHYNQPLSNIVYMGMGEPLLNYSQVIKSINRLHSEQGLGLSMSRITVSTAGIAKMIKQLGDDEVKFNLALSLHAANDVKRNEIMPINESNNLKSLVEAMDYYFTKTKNHITYEYILFNNFNDGEQDAKDLIKLCRRIPSKVNIIEYNPIGDGAFGKPDTQRTDNFINYLHAHNIKASLRRSRGKDIDAACGQLANKSN